jgi:hypothetical protein
MDAAGGAKNYVRDGRQCGYGRSSALSIAEMQLTGMADCRHVLNRSSLDQHERGITSAVTCRRRCS